MIELHLSGEIFTDEIIEHDQQLFELKEKGVTKEEFLRSREQMKSGMFFTNESSNSQMLLYGKYMLYFNKLFDFEDKLESINNMTYENAQETLSVMFNEEENAVALVGNTDTPLSL